MFMYILTFAGQQFLSSLLAPLGQDEQKCALDHSLPIPPCAEVALGRWCMHWWPCFEGPDGRSNPFSPLLPPWNNDPISYYRASWACWLKVPSIILQCCYKDYILIGKCTTNMALSSKHIAHEPTYLTIIHHYYIIVCKEKVA